MIQKKICMVGVFATGKTSLVQRYVYSIFSDRYLSTVGVKIDRKEIQLGDQSVTLMLWDLEGRDGTRDVNASYVRGAHGVIYVVDGTRRDTLDGTFEIHTTVKNALGEIPSVVAVNKTDLANDWQLNSSDEKAMGERGLHQIRTSAKTGQGVGETFRWVAEATFKKAGE
ncbi:MAG: Rab family GTPase [Gemmatimonadaceae bacterium]